jgi:CxxC motif-containing protein (DUF1111 family)
MPYEPTRFRPPTAALARLLFAGCVLSSSLAACSRPEPAATTATPGEPIAGLTDAQRGRFLLGRALFERLATPEEGLGPLFNAERCSACHDQPASGGSGTQVLVLKATAWRDGACSLLTEHGGDNIQQRATPQLLAAGFGPETVPAEATATALVTAPPLFGVGLLETVPEAVLLRHADPDDADGDGISGRVPRFADGRVARFGRKGDAATVGAFVETALRFELGFTTVAHPHEEARNGMPVPDSIDLMADPEMDSATMATLTDYVRLLAPPAPETAPASADPVRRGETAFREIGCDRCHTPSLTTGSAPEAALSNKRIQAWSDLLLHDLGEEASDVCTPQATPGEYRTAPLWGLRYRKRYLHGGTAVKLEDAIAAHRGEASTVTAAFRALPPERQRLLLRFLESL